MDEYQFANLRPELLTRIRHLENELSSELNEKIVLLAYDKKNEMAQP